MPQCPTCGKALELGVRFCPDDGTPLTETAAGTGVHTPARGHPPSKEIELPATVGNRYRLLEVRGGGGMATVYRAIDTTLEREVAVKVINPELRSDPEFDARFQREARIASQLADPHIVVVHDYGLDPALGPFLVMEFLQGQSLRERLQREGPLPLKAGMQLSAQLMLALIHAHEKGIVHRDIKPDNVFLLNQSGVRLHLRVLDFGIARIYKRGEPSHAETLTRPGSVVGTPRYMSPEQLGGQPLDARSDLYSAAMVIHEALSGQLPYISGKQLQELCPLAPADLQSLLDQCLKPNPAERPANAVEVYLRLQELGKASGILLLPPGAMQQLLDARKAKKAEEQPEQTTVTLKTGGWTRRQWQAAVVSGTAALAAAGSAGLVWWFRRTPTRPDRESLLDIEIGQSRDDVIARLQKPQHEVTGNPWQGDSPEMLGHVLRPELLGDAQALGKLQVLWWHDHQIGVMLRENRVQAVLVHGPHSAESGRGVAIGTKVAKLKEWYDERPRTDSYNMTAAKGRSRWGECYWFDSLGIGFEVENERVSAIVLYPPKAGSE